MSILDADEGTVLSTIKAHSKYCVQAIWNTSGTGFVTASWDQSLCIYEWPAGQHQRCRKPGHTCKDQLF